MPEFRPFCWTSLLPNQPKRNAAALAGIDAAMKQKPGGFFTPHTASLVTPGNFEDNLDDLRAAATGSSKPSSRISRSSATCCAKSRPSAARARSSPPTPAAFRWPRSPRAFRPNFAEHFLGTHFFNPPRYLHLVEMIPGAETRPEILEFVADFCDRHLGKGVVDVQGYAELHRQPHRQLLRRHRPQAHRRRRLHRRRGGRADRSADRAAAQRQLPPDGHRRASTCGRTSRAICTHAVPDDPWRDRFVLPHMMEQMIERGWLGEKRGQGFYKRVGKEKEIHALDWKTLEYHPAQKPTFPAVEAANDIENLPERLRALVAATIAPARSCGSSSAICSSTPPRWCRRSPTASWRSIAPCAGATPTRWGRSSCGMRWASKTR